MPDYLQMSSVYLQSDTQFSCHLRNDLICNVVIFRLVLRSYGWSRSVALSYLLVCAKCTAWHRIFVAHTTIHIINDRLALDLDLLRPVTRTNLVERDQDFDEMLRSRPTTTPDL